MTSNDEPSFHDAQERVLKWEDETGRDFIELVTEGPDTLGLDEHITQLAEETGIEEAYVRAFLNGLPDLFLSEDTDESDGPVDDRPPGDPPSDVDDEEHHA